jgi:hypothetical protein
MSVDRRLTFYAWADTNEKHPFDRLAAAATVQRLSKGEVVLDHGEDELTAVEIVAVGRANSPTKLLLHALHGPSSRPSEYGPGVGTRTIQIGKDRYTAFTGHVSIWADKIAAIDMHANCPGFGRLSAYLRHSGDQKVVFRPLFVQETAERLKDLEGIRGVDFAIHEPVKVTQARKRGMLRSLLPSRKFPSIHVAAGMSRREPRDAYFEPEVEEELFELADSAEQFFDRLIIRGLSKTEKTPTGQKKSVEVNLLSERLHIATSLEHDPENPSLPIRDLTFSELNRARRQLDRDGKLAAAAEARLALDQTE